MTADVMPRWIVVIACLLIAGCGGSAEPAKATPPATVSAPVKEADLTSVKLTAEAEKRLGIVTVLVERKAVPRIRVVGGEITPPSGARISITAPVAGTLQPGSLPRAGTMVTRGQTLFRLTPIQPSERDAGVDAQQALETALARREAAAKKVQRADQLLRDGAGSRRALEEAQAELSVAEAEVKAAQGRVALAGRSGATSGGMLIQSPETAIVQAVHVNDGQTVAASAPLIDLVRLDLAWVKVPIYAGESADIDPAQRARVLALSDRPDAEGVMAKPIAAPPVANPATASVDLYYAFSNADQRFRPGERVTVRLPRKAGDEALVVPKAALLHDAFGGTWVYVARDQHTFTRHRVAVADIIGQAAVLSRGPDPGMRVVTEGAAELFGTEFGTGK